MKKVHLFLAEGFEESEALVVVDILRRGGVNVKTVSVTDKLEVKGAHGILVTADELFEAHDLENSDMFVLPGGMPGALNLANHEGLLDAIVRHAKKGGDLAAICAAPIVYGKLGLLEGCRVTAYPGFEGQLTGAKYTGELVQQDGSIITGKGPAAAMPFGFALLARIAGEEKAEEVKIAMLYNELLA